MEKKDLKKDYIDLFHEKYIEKFKKEEGELPTKADINKHLKISFFIYIFGIM